MDLECELLGWPPDGPTLRLDYRRFSYAGKFVMSSTGKAVARDGEEIVAAVAFNEDRTDSGRLWLRYVTVEQDRRGGGIGPELLRFARDRAIERGYDRLRIAVNNPFAYEALYRSGFAYTGETTGIAELVLEYPRPGETAGDAVSDGHAADDSARDAADDNEEDATDASARDAADDDIDEVKRSPRARYQAGLEEFRDRELSDEERDFLDDRRASDPPDPDS